MESEQSPNHSTSEKAATNPQTEGMQNALQQSWDRVKKRAVIYGAAGVAAHSLPDSSVGMLAVGSIWAIDMTYNGVKAWLANRR